MRVYLEGSNLSIMIHAQKEKFYNQLFSSFSISKCIWLVDSNNLICSTLTLLLVQNNTDLMIYILVHYFFLISLGPIPIVDQ